MSEEILIRQGAPTLAGIKTAPPGCGGICGTRRRPSCCGRRAMAMRAVSAVWRGLSAASAKAKSSRMR